MIAETVRKRVPDANPSHWDVSGLSVFYITIAAFILGVLFRR
jgi:hypothetical protein